MRFCTTFLLMVLAIPGFAQEPSHSFPSFYTLHALHADIVPLSEAQKVALADAIVEGEVVETQSFWKNDRIASTLTLESNDDHTLYTVDLIGGALEGMGAHCTAEMYLNTGARGTFYLRGNPTDGWRPACGVQSYEPAQRAVHTMGLQRSNLTLSTEWIGGNAMEYLTITGTGFGNSQGSGYVTFETGNGYYDASAGANFNYTQWTNTSITVEVPQAQSNRVRVVTNDGTTLESTDSLHIRYNLGNQPYSYYGYTHMNNQGTGGHFFHVNEDLFNVPERLEAIERTLEDFVCKTGVNFQLSDTPTPLGWDLGDGQNTISFDDANNPLSAGTVGYCNTSWWSCILGDVTFFVVGEMDVVLNDNFNYDYSTGSPGPGQAKFAYVLMHELGHAMRLGHVNEWGETMYPSVTDWPSNNWYERDSISTHDRLGVSQAVDIASTFTFSACGISAMVPLDVDCVPVVDVADAEPASVDAPFPNPFSDVLTLPAVAGGWSAFNATGACIANFPASTQTIDTGHWPAGCYVLRTREATRPQAFRLIKD